MTYAELIQLYFERSNALQWYWTLYVVIIGGLLAFASMRQRRDRLTTVLVTVLFVFFAYKNQGAIQDASKQRVAILEAVDKTVAYDAELYRAGKSTRDVKITDEKLRPTMVQPDLGGIRTFHYTCDALTVAALWAMERRRRVMADEAAKSTPVPR
jgi:hypothetical protein